LRLRVLQLSDLHFDAPLTAGRLGLDEETARRREQERREAFARAIDLVRREDLDGVLLPGDLFDDELVRTDTLRFVAETLARVAPKPVFIAPGNHDPYSGASPYRAGRKAGSREFAWPDNVHIFAHEDFRTVDWPGQDVKVTACGVAANRPSEERRLRAPIERPPAAISILLFHGSRDDGAFLQAGKSTYPFSEEELRRQGFTWTALGHYHGHQVLHWADGAPAGAYSGCLIGGGLDETGPKGALIVELGEGAPRVRFVPLDRRKVVAVEADLSGCGHAEAARARIEGALADAGAVDDDLVALKLSGRRMAGLDLDFLPEYRGRFFHFHCDLSRLTVDIDLDRYPKLEEARTTEERLVARLRERIEGGDAAEADTARRALLYALDALRRGRLDTRYEA